MNFVFISPNFPSNYYHFVVALHKNNVNVLGVGDTPYDSLNNELKEALTEYYYVSDLNNYNDLIKAMGYFTFRYGKIDWVESLNEFWLENDAKLRSDFNITTGLNSLEISRYKLKSVMKKYYQLAGVKTARYELVKDKEDCLKFIKEVSYPVVIKPNNGVGASDTWKIKNEEDLDTFFSRKREIEYIMEEYVDGYIRTFDGVSDSLARPLYTVSHVEMDSLMDSVLENHSCWYYVDKDIPMPLRNAGEKVLLAFQAKNRFFHCEFFIAKSDKPGRWKKGEVLGLEVNMRCPGGPTVDMENFSGSLDLYQVWADMVAYGENRHPLGDTRYYCNYIGRRNNRNYKHATVEIEEKYHDVIKMQGEIPFALSDDMGDYFYMANFNTFEEGRDFARFGLEEETSDGHDIDLNQEAPVAVK
ncbi:MAG: ATP-grasp domain-containing protein [Bacilli bacterium]|nr:ATP-grasp domain-containing protein [Bacilli bacterium]